MSQDRCIIPVLLTSEVNYKDAGWLAIPEEALERGHLTPAKGHLATHSPCSAGWDVGDSE